MAEQVRASNIEQGTARSTFPALATSFGLSVLFLVVYSGCNWITGRRAQVPTFYFEWERSLPFVPWLIVPYLSIDLFYLAAPFLCRTRRELRTYTLRIVVVTLVAGVCYLLFPLRFAFERPTAPGISGALFNAFRTLDAPYNLAPSLHATYWVLLVHLYWKDTKGFVRLTIMVWFALMSVSPILTYQHHVIDIVTGLALGSCSLELFRDDGFSSPGQTSHPHNQPLNSNS